MRKTLLSEIVARAVFTADKVSAPSRNHASARSHSSATASVKNPGHTVLGGSHGANNPAPVFSSAENVES